MAIQRGQLCLVDLNLARRRGQAGQGPVLVVSADASNRLPLALSSGCGTKGANVHWDYPTNVRGATSESGLPMETVFLCVQLRPLDPGRFPKAPAGRASEVVGRQVGDAVRHGLRL